MMKKKVVILGSEGLVGTDLMLCLGEVFEVRGVDRPDLDVRNKDSVSGYLEKAKPNIVINCTVASANADQAEKEKEATFAVNVEGVKHITGACRIIGSKLVQFSSDYVFDGSKNTPYRETDATHPLNVYGESKVIAEQYIQQTLDDHLIVRTSWIFGGHGRNFVDTILKIANEKKQVKVVDDQVGCPTYSKDLANAIKDLIIKDATGIIHITNQGCCSWFQFAEEIIRLAGINDVKVTPISTEQYASKTKRPKYSVLDTSKLKNEYQNQMPTWREALKEYLEMSKKCFPQ